MELKRICIVGGAGHVGLPLAMMLAERGFTVDILDRNDAALDVLRAGRMPFMEEGGEELLRKVLPTGRLKMTTDPAVVREAQAVICVIGTPVDEHLSPDLVGFYRVIDEMRPHFRDGQTLILRSTVYPGLSERIHRMFRESGPNVHVAFCPERVAQGHSLREIRDLPQIVSAFDAEGLAVARQLFSEVARELIDVKPMEAELAKLMCNCYRYITFAIANQFHMLATDAGVDFAQVHRATTLHYPRTEHMPRPGLAAGPCLLKDTMQLAAFANNNFFLGHAAMLVNEGQPQFIVNCLKRRTELRTKRVGILGMTFKADCDDTRDSLCFKLRKLLMLEAREVVMHDPYLDGEGYLPLAEVLAGCDVIVVGVPHKEYRGLRIPAGKVVEDVWNCLAKEQGA
ncbi:MAG: nucleotide sugar dehydrogenase [Planctomycetes bacterium]|nr:nucleotide sugar dehydrogenase [Planctomycetota bacterium]